MKKMLAKYRLRKRDAAFLYSYSEKINANIEVDEMPTNESKKLMIEVFKDFQAGHLSADDVSAVCELLYAKFEHTDPDLYDLLLLGSEIEWYLRWDPMKAGDFLNELKKVFGSD